MFPSCFGVIGFPPLKSAQGHSGSSVKNAISRLVVNSLPSFSNAWRMWSRS
jgi:hypothetical protein